MLIKGRDVNDVNSINSRLRMNIGQDPTSKQLGFTLIEVLIALAIVLFRWCAWRGLC